MTLDTNDLRTPAEQLPITLKAKYRIARYEDLPAAKYADCVAFIQQSYRALTGADLDLPEQTTLDLGDS
jgi:hypothetical protein